MKAKKLLCAIADPVLQLAVAAKLEGNELAFTNNGYDLWKRVTTGSHDAVVAENGLRGMEAIPALRQAQDTGNTTPCVILSSKSSVRGLAQTLGHVEFVHLTSVQKLDEIVPALERLIPAD